MEEATLNYTESTGILIISRLLIYRFNGFYSVISENELFERLLRVMDVVD